MKCDGVTRSAGYPSKEHFYIRSHEADALAEASNGYVVCACYLSTLPSNHMSTHSNSQAFIDQAGVIHQQLSHHHGHTSIPFTDNHQAFPDLPPCSQLVAYATGFAALTTTGAVYTWGDERYGACLGRDLSSTFPAEKPGLVTALQDLPTGPIVKIAAGGYMLAALTAGDDLYVWDGHPGRQAMFADIGEEPAPVVVGDELDVADVAVGEEHLIVLTTDGRVFVVGGNGNGQLGLPVKSADSWLQVELNLEEGRRVVGVAAGPRNSFIMVKGG